ncbi:MAG: hypothetical protein MZV65_54125 [Chromatiales bacterium]|nr:hypothetical protein [Chromatiales bacterium]
MKAIEPGGQASPFTSVSKVETTSNSLLSPRGQVTVDQRTNSLLIQDTASKIKEIRKLISHARSAGAAGHDRDPSGRGPGPVGQELWVCAGQQ